MIQPIYALRETVYTWPIHLPEQIMPELSRQSGGLDINIEDGVPFPLGATYKINSAAVDVTGYTATFELRSITGSSEVLLSLTEASGITVGGVDGKFDIELTALQTIFGNREMVYDLIITPPVGNAIRLLRGACKSWAQGD